MNDDTLEHSADAEPARRRVRYEIRWWVVPAAAVVIAALAAIARFSTFAAEATALAILIIPAAYYVWSGFRRKHGDLPPADTASLHVLPHSDGGIDGGGGGGNCGG